MMDKMRILLVHNHYQHRSGEDIVFSSEGQLLRDHGHTVGELTRDNLDIPDLNSLNVAAQTVWSRPAVKAMEDKLSSFNPDVVHVHNLFPLISPAVLYACRERDTPVVATLHNYRLVCPKATLFRDGRSCYKCLGLVPAWHSVRYACYRKSRLYSALLAGSIGIHWWLGSWHRLVKRYIALSRRARNLLVQGGLPRDKIIVKQNPVYPDPGVGTHQEDYCLYVGRLSEEKGVDTLIAAAQKLRGRHFVVIGASVKDDQEIYLDRISALDNIRYLGQLSREEVFEAMKNARFLVFPSVWDEPFGLGIVESFACGLPVIASDRGALPELIENGKTGLLFPSGDAEALAKKVAYAYDHPEVMRGMGLNARREYERRYSGQENIRRLIEIYRRCLGT